MKPLKEQAKKESGLNTISKTNKKVGAVVSSKTTNNNNSNSTTHKTSTKQTKMPTPQEMQELYDKITPLQKIVTLQHIYSLYMAAAQQSEKKEVSFNIIQLQRMINSNPLVNPDFDFLNISGFLNSGKENTGKGSNSSHISNKGPVSPVQLIQILTESLTLRDERGRNEQVIQQVPNTMLFRLSKFIDLNFVKDRLIKLLNAYKNTTLKEIEELENKWKTKKNEIQKIEEGKMDDGVLYEEFLKDIKRKRGSVEKKSTIEMKKESNSKSLSPSPEKSNLNNADLSQGKKLQISRHVSKKMEKSLEIPEKASTKISNIADNNSKEKKMEGAPRPQNVIKNTNVDEKVNGIPNNKVNDMFDNKTENVTSDKDVKINDGRISTEKEREKEQGKDETKEEDKDEIENKNENQVNEKVKEERIEKSNNQKSQITMKPKILEDGNIGIELLQNIGEKKIQNIGENDVQKEINKINNIINENNEKDKRVQVIEEDLSSKNVEKNQQKVENEQDQEDQKDQKDQNNQNNQKHKEKGDYEKNNEAENQRNERNEEKDEKDDEIFVDASETVSPKEKHEETKNSKINQIVRNTRSTKHRLEDITEISGSSNKKAKIELPEEPSPEIETDEKIDRDENNIKSNDFVKNKVIEKNNQDIESSSNTQNIQPKELYDEGNKVSNEDKKGEKLSVTLGAKTRSKTNNEEKALQVTKSENKKFQQLSVQLITHISSHRIASMFLNPVNAHDEPQYYQLIKKPIDLKTIVKRIKSNDINSLEKLELEMEIMFTNAIMYNDMNQKDVYMGILDMKKEWESLVSMLKENM